MVACASFFNEGNAYDIVCHTIRVLVADLDSDVMPVLAQQSKNSLIPPKSQLVTWVQNGIELSQSENVLPDHLNQDWMLAKWKDVWVAVLQDVMFSSRVFDSVRLHDTLEKYLMDGT